MKQFDTVLVINKSSVDNWRFVGKIGVAVTRVKSKKFSTIAVCFDESWVGPENWPKVLDKAGVLVDDPWDTTDFPRVEEFINRGCQWGLFFEEELEVVTNKHLGSTFDSFLREECPSVLS